MNGLDELRRVLTKRIDQVDERAHKGQENLRDELTHVKSQARVDQAQLIRNTDQCLAESLAQANKESYEREARMTGEIERLLNDHDSTYAHTMTSLEKRLDAKSDLIRMGAIGRSVPTQGSAHAMQMMEMVRAAMPEPSKARERTTNPETRSGQGQHRRGLAGRIQSRRRQMPPRRQGCQLCHKSVQYQI